MITTNKIIKETAISKSLKKSFNKGILIKIISKNQKTIHENTMPVKLFFLREKIPFNIAIKQINEINISDIILKIY